VKLNRYHGIGCGENIYVEGSQWIIVSNSLVVLSASLRPFVLAMKMVLAALAPIQYAVKTLFLFTYTDYKTIFIPVVSITSKHLFRSLLNPRLPP